jgi:hypothetical protein
MTVSEALRMTDSEALGMTDSEEGAEPTSDNDGAVV